MFGQKLQAMTAALAASTSTMSNGQKDFLSLSNKTNEETLTDKQNASRSKRQMQLQRGAQPQYVKQRRFERAAVLHRKQKNRWGNNLQELNAQ